MVFSAQKYLDCGFVREISHYNSKFGPKSTNILASKVILNKHMIKTFFIEKNTAFVNNFCNYTNATAVCQHICHCIVLACLSFRAVSLLCCLCHYRFLRQHLRNTWLCQRHQAESKRYTAARVWLSWFRQRPSQWSDRHRTGPVRKYLRCRCRQRQGRKVQLCWHIPVTVRHCRFRQRPVQHSTRHCPRLFRKYLCCRFIQLQGRKVCTGNNSPCPNRCVICCNFGFRNIYCRILDGIIRGNKLYSIPLHVPV